MQTRSTDIFGPVEEENNGNIEEQVEEEEKDEKEEKRDEEKEKEEILAAPKRKERLEFVAPISILKIIATIVLETIAYCHSQLLTGYRP